MKEDITIVSKSLHSVAFSSTVLSTVLHCLEVSSRVKNFNGITEECETVKMNLRALLPPESDSFWSEHSSLIVLMISD